MFRKHNRIKVEENRTLERVKGIDLFKTYNKWNFILSPRNYEEYRAGVYPLHRSIIVYTQNAIFWVQFFRELLLSRNQTDSYRYWLSDPFQFIGRPDLLHIVFAFLCVLFASTR